MCMRIEKQIKPDWFKEFGSGYITVAMKDRKKGITFPLWCTIVILCLAGSTISTLRILLPEGFHPRLVSKWNIPAMSAVSSGNPATPATISIGETVIFPDQAVVFLKYPPSSSLFTKDAINCTYLSPNSSSHPHLNLPSLSVDFDYERHQIVRCPLPPRGAVVYVATEHNGNLTPGPMYRWDSLAYEAMIDDQDNTTVAFVKGLNLRSGRVADSSKFKCIYGLDLTKPKFVLSSDVVSVAQEIVRCKTPLSILNSSQRLSIKVSVRAIGRKTVMNSIARVERKSNPYRNAPDKKRHEMCVCTMLRNQARFLREWIVYHSRIGVQRYFIYDNNSDDEIERVLDSLTGNGHNVSRRLWPWVKTQEAGFAHCALTARDSCEWVGFIDVDEFLHLPSNLSLHDFITNQTRPSDVAELRISCHSFGPSGLKRAPARGVLVGYTCRLAAPERHKSIVKPEALSSNLINFVHHFNLKDGYRHVNVNRSVVVINHYKYQVWEVFKEKFYRRVATYVSDWQQARNVGSKDRAPGLGTRAVEPLDWSSRFCEVKDNRLRNRVLENFADRENGLLPWEDRFDLRS